MLTQTKAKAKVQNLQGGCFASHFRFMRRLFDLKFEQFSSVHFNSVQFGPICLVQKNSFVQLIFSLCHEVAKDQVLDQLRV